MNNAAHLIEFDNLPENGDAFDFLLSVPNAENTNLSDINFSTLLPIPTNIVGPDEIHEWCMNNWNNTGNSMHTDVVDEQTLEFETNNGHCQKFIELWAKKFQFTGKYRAISSDLKDWRIIYFNNGEVESSCINNPAEFNNQCYELRGFHYFEVVDKTSKNYIKHLADEIAFYLAFDFVIHGEVAKFSHKNGNQFDLSYSVEQDKLTALIGGTEYYSDVIDQGHFPAEKLENFADLINVQFKRMAGISN